MQRYTIYLFLWNSLQVSGGSSAHHQELKTVYAYGTVIPSLQRQWQVAVKFDKVPDAAYTVLAPDDGQRNCLKHVEHFTEINKLCSVASCWLYLEICARNYFLQLAVTLHI